jgi:hypothetical protein
MNPAWPRRSLPPDPQAGLENDIASTARAGNGLAQSASERNTASAGCATSSPDDPAIDCRYALRQSYTSKQQ